MINVTLNDHDYKSVIVNIISYDLDISVRKISHASGGWEMDVYWTVGGSYISVVIVLSLVKESVLNSSVEGMCDCL